MELTFVVPCRPFVGVFDELQRRAIASWRRAVPNARILLLGSDLPPAAQLDADAVLAPATNGRGITILTGVWEIACRQQSAWVCVGESDILFDASLPHTLAALEGVERPFVIAQRWDMAADGTRRLHPPSAMSFCLWRGGTIRADGIPPFAVGRTLHDNWLVWAAIERWQMTVIDATECLTAIHIDHPYAEYGDKEGMFRSAERAENQRMGYATGMPRPYGIDDTPYRLTPTGQVQAKERMAA